MKRILVILSFLFILPFVSPIISQAEINVQQLIDAANPKDTIQLPAGAYVENITIDKPLTLIGERNVVIKNDTTHPILTIKADGVTVENIHLQYDTDDTQSPAILVQGAKNELTKLTIETNSYGIRLDEANENVLSQIKIEGKRELPINQRKAGIDLWISHNNEVYRNEIKDVEDGIYVESSNHNQIYDNLVTHSRYGYHLMFTKDTVLEQNESYENISGMMVMGTKNTTVKKNSIKYNQKNVQSLGLLLFDEKNTTVRNNEIAHNRIGILIEASRDNVLDSNNVHNNYVGVQLKQAEKNKVTNNVFTANVVQGQAENSTNNETNRNYWGDHVGLDLTGNMMSDLPKTIDPFYLHLTNEYPPYRLLFHSPGMVFLEQLLHTPVEERLTDFSPLMENPLVETSTKTEDEQKVLLFSSMFLLISTSMIMMGVRK